MNRSQLVAASIITLMVLSAIPVQEAQAANSYTEKLNVYVAGSDALWYFTFGGVNGSASLSALESTPGLSWYNVTAIKTTGWTSDFQLFGVSGYDLLPVPFVPSQGLFLTVGSDSYRHAASAASALDSYFLTSFTSLSNGTGTYSFYSPISFNDLVPVTLLRFLPSTEGGFASAISSNSFLSLASPFVVLEGVRSSTGFTHSLVVGSITPNALTNSEPSIMGYFGTSPSFLSASNHSSSSTVQLTFLDGQVKSSDSGALVRNTPQFKGFYTGFYSLAMAPGDTLSKVNATVVEQPAPLLASRTVDQGVLKTGDDLAVTLTLKDLSATVTIDSISFSDNWWNKTGDFKFLSGTYAVSNQALGAGGSITPVYRLQYTGTSPGAILIPASVVTYQYLVNGVAFNATAALNPIRLSLGADDAVVVATVTPNGSLGRPVGDSQGFNITVTNVGTLPASSVVVAGHSIPGLAARSGSATVTVTQSASGLVGTNSTEPYTVTYQDPAGTTRHATTNVVHNLFSHSSMDIGFPTLAVGGLASALANQQTNLTLTFITSNSGLANVTSFRAVGQLPAGLGCGTISGEGLSCTGGVLTISYPVLNASSIITAYMQYNLTSPLDYLLQPLNFTGMTSGTAVSGGSNGAAIPAGVAVSKQFAPSELFSGMNSEVTLTATNAGPLPAYNATVSSTSDSFDSATSTAVLSKQFPSIAPGGNVTLSYDVTLATVTGVQVGAQAAASFYFGATPFSISSSAPRLTTYRPLGVSITTTPSTPEEGKNFTIYFEIINPTGLQVSNVTFTLPMPSGLGLSHLVNAQFSSGLLTIHEGALDSHANITASVVAVASSGITIPYERAALTFTYAGVTIHGTVPSSSGIGIAENVFTRYVIPTTFILIVVFAVAFYVRRKAATVPASPK